LLVGGTDIIVMARGFRREEAFIVDLKHIPDAVELSYCSEHGLHLGAAVGCYQIYETEQIVELYPALIDPATLIGDIQLQGRASIGGTLCRSAAADSISALMTLGMIC
jgi:carbon-monoxide dehydrogenase medium subunit